MKKALLLPILLGVFCVAFGQKGWSAEGKQMIYNTFLKGFENHENGEAQNLASCVTEKLVQSYSLEQTQALATYEFERWLKTTSKDCATSLGMELNLNLSGNYEGEGIYLVLKQTGAKTKGTLEYGGGSFVVAGKTRGNTTIFNIMKEKDNDSVFSVMIINHKEGEFIGSFMEIYSPIFSQFPTEFSLKRKFLGEQLIGCWKEKEGTYIEIRNDGSYKQIVLLGENILGTWSIKNNALCVSVNGNVTQNELFYVEKNEFSYMNGKGKYTVKRFSSENIPMTSAPKAD